MNTKSTSVMTCWNQLAKMIPMTPILPNVFFLKKFHHPKGGPLETGRILKT